MTVENSNSTKTYIADGVQTTFPYDFLVQQASDMSVFTINQTTGAVEEIVSFTVTEVGNPAGGDVITTVPPTGGLTVLLARWVDATQLTDYVENDPFPAETHEAALDKLTMLCIQLLERTGGPDFGAGSGRFLGINPSNVNEWTAENQKIVEVSDPTEPQDAATRAFVEAQIIAAGNLPAPLEADVGRVLTARAVDDAGWLDPVQSNLLVNGGFDVNQRGGELGHTASSTYPNVDGGYTLDQWVLLSDGNDVVNVSQELTTRPPGAAASIALKVNTPGTQFGVLQPIEASAARRLAGQSVSMSFKALCDGTLTLSALRAAVVSWEGAADNIATIDVVETWNGSGADPTLRNQWTYAATPTSHLCNAGWLEYRINNIMIPANANNIAVFIWSDATGAVAGETLYLGDVQLVPGTLAVPIIRRQFSDELAACQRYFQKTFPYAMDPKTMAGVDTGEIRLRYHDAIDRAPWFFAVTMLRAPDPVTVYNPVTDTFNWRDFGDDSGSPATVSVPSETKLYIQADALSSAPNNASIHATAEAVL